MIDAAYLRGVSVPENVDAKARKHLLTTWRSELFQVSVLVLGQPTLGKSLAEGGHSDVSDAYLHENPRSTVCQDHYQSTSGAAYKVICHCPSPGFKIPSQKSASLIHISTMVILTEKSYMY